MKKVLLDICFREEMLKQTGTESAIADLDKNSALFKKITEKIVGQSNKYPKNGATFDQAESIKFKNNLITFRMYKNDLVYTNDIISQINANQIHAAV